MPKSKVIPREQRLEIFLDYRRSRKVYPTAKKHNIARSTVTSIVEEFREDGFADAPRPALSQETLTIAQDLHLKEVVDQLGAPPSLQLFRPSDRPRGGLEPKEAMSKDAFMNVKERDPLGMSESPVWHIMGTATERVVQESRRAVGDYNQRCLFLWREILSSLENSLKLEVYPYSGKGDKPEGPHFFHQLVDLLYAELWSSLGAPMPTRTRFGWTTDAKDSTLFIALTKPVAVGRPTDYNTVIDGTENFIAEYWEPLQRRAVELDRLHGDLCYLRDIVADQLNNISAEDVGKGICPACPYPESRRIVSADPKTT